MTKDRHRAIASSMCSMRVKTTGPFAVTSTSSSSRHVCSRPGCPANVSMAKYMFSLISAGYLSEYAREIHMPSYNVIALANQLVGRPAAVRARVAPRGDDDVVDDLAAALEHELVHLGFDLALAHARLQPLVLDLPHRGVADARCLLQQLDFVARLDGS